MAAVLKEEVPLVYEALIGERDTYMARAIADSVVVTGASASSRTGVSSGVSEGLLVGVVGMMHLDGIEKHLVNDHGFKIVSTNCPRSDVLETNQLSPSRSFENVIIS
jgi:pheromone shutdown protein TraB